jgi:hypothetical protein
LASFMKEMPEFYHHINRVEFGERTEVDALVGGKDTRGSPLPGSPLLKRVAGANMLKCESQKIIYIPHILRQQPPWPTRTRKERGNWLGRRSRTKESHWPLQSAFLIFQRRALVPSLVSSFLTSWQSRGLAVVILVRFTADTCYFCLIEPFLC